MATIKEMAEKYTIDYCHKLNRDEEGGALVNIPKLATDSYMAGANAVLEEIDNFIFNTIQMKDVIEPHLILIKIRKKFKELKGE